MGTTADKLTYLNDTKTAIKDAIIAKGVDVADDVPFRNYADKIGDISGGEVVDKSKYGLTIDDVLGNVNEQGEYVAPTGEKTFDGAGIISVGDVGFQYSFGQHSNVKKLIMNDLTNAGYYSFSYSFYKNQKQPVAIFQNLVAASGSNCFEHFMDSAVGGFPQFPKLKQALGYQGFYYFMTNTVTPDYDLMFPVLEVIAGEIAFRLAGKEQNRGYTLSAVKRISAGSRGTLQPPSATNNDIYLLSAEYLNGKVFGTNTRVVHFAKKNQAIIEALDGYDIKFAESTSAANNMTFVFDLITYITVNDIVYTRSEQDSIRPNIYTKTYIAWKSDSGDIVYTDYANNAEPDVDTVVYSDEGITQVGIVSAIE